MPRGARRPGPSLRVKLVAVLLCLLAAGAAVVITVGASALRGQLVRQAGQQLRAYANQLTSQSFQVLGTSRGAPVAVPFAAAGTAGGARAPGTAGRAGTASAAGAGGAAAAAAPQGAMVSVPAGGGAFSLELRDGTGQWLLSVGPGIRPGQSVPAPFAPVPARTGVLRTVPGVGGSYLVIAEPVHFQAHRLVFGYGADDFAITGQPRTGQIGTLVIGLRLTGVGQTVRRLTLRVVAVSAAVLLIAGGLAWAAIRISLRPVSRAARTAESVAASDLSAGMPEWPDSGLAGPLHGTLTQLGARFTASAAGEAAARSATDRMNQSLESAAQELRRPISLLHGVTEHWAHHDRRGAADTDRALGQVATEAARAETVLDQLDSAGRDSAVSQDRG